MEKAWPRHSALNLLYHKIIFNNSLYDLSFSVLLCYKVPLSFEALRYSCTSYSSSETEWNSGIVSGKTDGRDDKDAKACITRTAKQLNGLYGISLVNETIL